MSDPNQTHVANLTQSFKGIPREKFREKLTRSIVGVMLAVCGFGVLYLYNAGLIGKSEWLERIGLVLVALGFLTASYEFVSAPLRFALALAKDVANIAIAVLARKKSNGDGGEA